MPYIIHYGHDATIRKVSRNRPHTLLYHIDFQSERVEQYFVLRDDLLNGGTKRRALNILLNKIPQSNIFYAGTIMGHGALALAHACQDSKKVAEIFISANGNEPMIQKLQQTNAILHLHLPLPISILNGLAESAAEKQNAIHLPPAFNMPAFEDCMIASLQNFDDSPYSEIWTCAVTGTLTRALQKAFPQKIFKTVKVVKADCDLGKSEIFQASEKYHQLAKSPPPYSSCPFTDAKVWQLVKKHAANNALIWNTAG